MPAYTINAVDRSGGIITIASTDKARKALDTFRATVRFYPRAWVLNDAGHDVSEGDLMELAADEERGG